MNYLIRPAEQKDLSDLLKLSRAFPLYNLPKNKKLLKEKLELSEQSFQKKQASFKRNYLFVLEDLKSKKLIASSQIISFFNKNYSYCYFLEKNKNSASLKLFSRESKRQQLGGLILEKSYRKSKEQLGLQISLARFLYIKQNERDFSKKIEVSLTGPFQNKDNPFWMETGAKYVKKNYLQVLEMYRKDPSSFLKKLPKNFEIPIQSLSKKAQLTLEKVHPETWSAYKGLLKRGFKTKSCYHLLDGGIYLESQTKNLVKPIQKLKLQFLKEGKKKNLSFFLISPLSLERGQEREKEQEKGKKRGTEEEIKNLKTTKDSKKAPSPFIALRVRAEKVGKILRLEKKAFLKEGDQVLSLALS